MANHAPQVDRRLPAETCRMDGIAQAGSQPIVPAGIESRTAMLGKSDYVWIDIPVLRNLNSRGIYIADRVGHVLTEFPSIIGVLRHDHAHLVIAKAVHMIFVDKKNGIINQELPHLTLPDRPYRSRVILISEVQAVIGIGTGCAIEEVQTLRIILDLNSSVVVDHVQQNSYVVHMEQLDHNL